MALQDSDNLIIGRGDTSYKISYSELKDELGTGGGGGALSQTGVSITATPPGQVPTQLLAQGGIGLGPSGIIDPPDWSWYKDDVLIPGATSDTLDVTDPGTYKAVATVVDPALPEGENTSTKERSIGPLYGAVSMTELVVATTSDTAPATVTLSGQWTGPTDTTNSSGKPSGGGDDWQIPEYQLLIDDVVETDWSTDIPSYDVLDTITEDVKLTFKKRSLDNASDNYAEATKDQIIKAPVTGPTATMHGLRFDKDRDTRLSRSFGNTFSNTFTCSTWVKPLGKIARIVNISRDNTYNTVDKYVTMFVKADGTVYIEVRDGLLATTVPGLTLSPNTWHHLVLTITPTELNIYANGNPVYNTTSDFSSLSGLKYYQPGCTSYDSGDQYLSDYYFVDGQALPPETFGKSFDGKWGPLDSSVVKSKIGTKSPEFIAAFPDADYDTSQVWSSVVSVNSQDAALPLTNSFDGSTSTLGAASAGDNYEFNFGNLFSTEPVKLEVWSTNAVNFGFNILVDGVSKGSQVNDWVDCGTLSFTTITAENATSGGCINAIRVNGKILVDNPATFGANGFFLPFDPAATGENWSNGTTNQNVFDGNLTTIDTYASFPQIITTKQMTINSSFEIYSNDGVGFKTEVIINGNSCPAPESTDGSMMWRSVDLSSLTLPITVNGFSIDYGSSQNNYAAFRVDGKLLVDHNNIGVDASGNDNHFHDENFAVGNTSQVWSGLATGSQWNTTYLLENMFDGNPDTEGGLEYSDGNTGTLNFTGFSSITKFRMYAALSGQSSVGVAEGSIIINGIDITDGGINSIWAESGGLNNPNWVDIPVEDIGNKLETITLTVKGLVAPYIHLIEVDGKVLVDGNIADTVTDTPRRNYAVLEGSGDEITISNGNLVSTNGPVDSAHSNARSTQSMNTGKYYFESIPGANDYRDDNMIGVIKTTFGSSWVGNTGGSVGYSCTRGWKYVNGIATDKTLPLAILGDIVGVALDVDARTVDFYLNGTLVTSDAVPDGDLNFAVGHAGTANIVNFGQQPFAASNVTYDQDAGTVEIDGETYGTLYQTWEQWARTALGYAVDRIAKLEQRNVQLETLVEEARTRLAALELNEVSDDAVDTALITLIGNINDRLTALEESN